MFTQIFRNRISQSSELKKRIAKLEAVIRSNLNQKEEDIVEELTREWNRGGRLRLSPFSLGGRFYHLWIDFCQWKTHGLRVQVDDIIDLNSDRLEFQTEYGDIAIVVDYFFQHTHLNSRVSILQTKKEQRKGSVDIKLHQLYLMQYWPPVEFPTGTRRRFEGISVDEFSFYHFVLNYSRNSQFSSSLCSAPFVGGLLGTTKTYLEDKLKSWLAQRKTNPKKKSAPSLQLRQNLLPGTIYNASKNYDWKLTPKPFGRFLLDAAYLFVGTSHREVLALTKDRVPNILVMRVVGGREEQSAERMYD